MSELEADNTFVFGEECLAYKKSEADKVIEFWKKESHDHYERWFSLNKQYEGWFGKVKRCERAERELRHQKYKRCLKNAENCLYKVWYYDEVHYRNGAKRMWKWRNRWLKIAEQFKESK